MFAIWLQFTFLICAVRGNVKNDCVNDKGESFQEDGTIFIRDTETKCLVMICNQNMATTLLKVCSPIFHCIGPDKQLVKHNVTTWIKISDSCQQTSCNNGSLVHGEKKTCYSGTEPCESSSNTNKFCCSFLRPCNPECPLVFGSYKQNENISIIVRKDDSTLEKTVVFLPKPIPQPVKYLNAFEKSGIPEAAKRFLLASHLSASSYGYIEGKLHQVKRNSYKYIKARKDALIKGRKMDEIEKNLLRNGKVPIGVSSTRFFNIYHQSSLKNQRNAREALINTEAIAAILRKFPMRNSFLYGEKLKERSKCSPDITDEKYHSICSKKHKTVCQNKEVYRSADGTCNNLARKKWGSVDTGLRRHFPNTYLDGVFQPTSSPNLPSARVVSETLFGSWSKKSSKNTVSVMSWGQFLDHDMSHTPIFQIDGNQPIECCAQPDMPPPAHKIHPQCFPISISPTDGFYSVYKQRCMNFVRSLPALGTDCKSINVEQVNDVTHWIDGSQIYGSSIQDQQNLRKMKNGALRMNRSKLLPPKDDIKTANESGIKECAGCTCFKAGDTRVNENPILTLFHTLFVRHHNKIAKIISNTHPNWQDEKLFQETRRIVVAQLQHITYKEWLVEILGKEFHNLLGLSSTLNRNRSSYLTFIYPNIANSFSTAGFRLHNLVQDTIEYVNVQSKKTKSHRLRDTYFEPSVLQSDMFFEQLARGITTQFSQPYDKNFAPSIHGELFAVGPYGLDLVALNVQRGRDHGIAKYYTVLGWCSGRNIKHWKDLYIAIESETVEKLQKIYKKLEDVDLYSGINLEKPIDDSMLGLTSRCIVAEQFLRLKYADRFFYDLVGEPQSFSKKQIREIKKTQLSTLLCSNVGGNFNTIQKNAFLKMWSGNPIISCSKIPSVDYTVF